ncbi:MAG TPA: CHAT domain-containing protein [Abditibacteriaceae bacterium]
MSEGKVDISRGISPEQRRTQEDLRGRIDALNLQLMAGQTGATTETDPSQENTLKEQVSKAEADLRFFNDRLYAEHPELAQKRAATTITLPYVAGFLPEDTALFSYVSLNAENAKRTLLFVVTAQSGKVSMQTYSIDTPTDELGELLEDFRAACADPKKNYKAKARELYGLPIGLASQQIAGKKRLLICSDGALWGLPFQALLTKNEQGDERFLVEQYEVTYSYSATAAQAALNAKANVKRTRPTRTLLALANPEFGGKERFAASTQSITPLAAGSRPIAAGSRPIGADARAIAADSRAIGAASRALGATSRDLVL